MKYITFVVPCYNSQDYMERCLDSLIPGGRDVEIIIVDDGSTDNTAEIADAYANFYPDTVRVVHKENGGHGSGVNTGLSLAKGEYFKVVDSDDWLDPSAYTALLDKIKKFVRQEGEGGTAPDLFVCNYVYEHMEDGKSHTVNYKNIFPEEQECGWNEIGRFAPSQYLVMHALIYRTNVLHRAGVVLPEHTFYVDNIFACQPLPYVRTIYYMNIDLYRYFIGREDQSVNEKVLMRRIDQQIKVTRIVSKCVDLNKVREQYPKLAVYLLRNISIMMAISSIHLIMIETPDARQKRQKLWEEMKNKDRKLYRRLKYTTISGWTWLPGKLGGKLTLGGYRLARKIYRFQ